ncbi:MAG: bifunctional non-ous end joining protein LigD [Thermoplasmata archaeon]|jgi:bifunctional non-homologous end joining protein LigD|nr:bifunctional non-ous end joining protein LigD [Thermoplasmata archaeon]
MKVAIQGQQVELSNLDKVLYPQAAFTKAHVIDYYRRVSPALLPHLRDRPVTLKRYPDGVEGKFFYEKSCPPYRPAFVRTAPVWSEGRGEDIDYCVLDTLPALVWAANLADLEMHTFLHTAPDVARPHALVFDLDPGPGTDIVDCARLGLRVRDLFEGFGLACLAKTSGSKGLQVYAPLNTPASYEETKPFARAVAEMLERETPATVTSNMSKAERAGRVLVDWSQNDAHKTTVCAYSLRAKAQPTVSTPVTWEEIARCASEGKADLLRFLTEDVLERVETHGDLFRPVLDLEQALPALA